MLKECHVHRGYCEQDRDLVALQDLQGLRRLEPRDQGQVRTHRDGCVHPHRLAERVEQRQAAEDDIVGADVHEADRDLGVAPHVGVGQLGTLGGSRRARRVEHDRGVLVVALDEGDRLVGHDLAEEFRRHDADELRARLGGALAGLLGDAVPGEQGPGLGVAQDEGDLAGLVQRIHRDHDAAGPEDAVVDDRHVRDVGHRHRDPVTGLDAELLEPAGDPGGALGEHAVGDDRVIEGDGGGCGGRLRGAGEVAGEVHGRPSRRWGSRPGWAGAAGGFHCRAVWAAVSRWAASGTSRGGGAAGGAGGRSARRGRRSGRPERDAEGWLLGRRTGRRARLPTALQAGSDSIPASRSSASEVAKVLVRCSASRKVMSPSTTLRHSTRSPQTFLCRSTTRSPPWTSPRPLGGSSGTRLGKAVAAGVRAGSLDAVRDVESRHRGVADEDGTGTHVGEGPQVVGQGLSQAGRLTLRR